MSSEPGKSSVVVEVPEHPAYLSVVRQAVASIARQMGFDDVEILQLQMAADEACSNVMEHGRPKSGKIKLKFQALPDKLVMQVRDRCGRFSPLERGLPDLDSYFRSPTGRGLGLVILRNFVDEIRHSYRPNSGNTLSLTKYLSGEEKKERR
ncbi:MAG TPA: ATP-binding protein [Planctomycetota bacterium]|nr:ATP-binding protein [Planctomycetota bacterium]HUW34523.1 ATP-binding protein [Planctomycetota bacterium]